MRRSSREVAARPTTSWFVPGLLVVLVAFVALAWPFAPHTVDDAWITFRYSRQWSLGHGPYFNPGEHVEGYSNFLLMGLLTPVVALGGAGAALPAAKAIGLVSSVLAVLGAGVLGRQVAHGTRWADAAGVGAAGLVASVPGFAYHAMSGLETSLYSCLLTWGVLGLVTGLVTGSARATLLGGLALAAAAITRPEGPLMLALAWITTAVARWLAPPEPATIGSSPGRAPWGPLLAAGLVGAAAVLGQLAFRHAAYDGEWLPNTYLAKLGGSGDRFAYVRDALRTALLREPGIVFALLGWVVGGRLAPAWWVAAVVGVAGGLLPLAVGADWMLGGRFVVPYLPLLAVVAVCGWARLLSRATGGRHGVVAVALLLAVLLNHGLARGTRATLLRSAALETQSARTGHGALATWLGERARPGDTILLMDIGQVGYRCIEQRILDVTGLTDRTIAKSPGRFIDKAIDLAYVFDQAPDFIVLAFLTRGSGDEPYDPRAPLHPFSEMERRLASHPEFLAHYPRPTAAAGSATDALGEIQEILGAEAVFPYSPLGPRYLLAAYPRRR